jgi:hypothetical protein
MVLISFNSDSSYNAQGFLLKYEVDSRYPVSVLHDDFKLWKYDPKENSYLLPLLCLVVIVVFVITYLIIYKLCSCKYTCVDSNKNAYTNVSQIQFYWILSYV